MVIYVFWSTWASLSPQSDAATAEMCQVITRVGGVKHVFCNSKTNLENQLYVKNSILDAKIGMVREMKINLIMGTSQSQNF